MTATCVAGFTFTRRVGLAHQSIKGYLGPSFDTVMHIYYIRAPKQKATSFGEPILLNPACAMITLKLTYKKCLIVDIHVSCIDRGWAP